MVLVKTEVGVCSGVRGDKRNKSGILRSVTMNVMPPALESSLSAATFILGKAIVRALVFQMNGQVIFLAPTNVG